MLRRVVSAYLEQSQTYIGQMRDGLATVITGYDDVRGLLDGVRDGAHRAVRRTAGLEVDPLDTPTPSAQREGPGLDR